MNNSRIISALLSVTAIFAQAPAKNSEEFRKDFIEKFQRTGLNTTRATP